MKSDLEKLIEKNLSNYEKTKTIEISGKDYTLYVVPQLCDEDLNIFEGFLFVKVDNKSDFNYLKNRYQSPVSGYAPRIGLIFSNNHLLIKDYRKNRHIIKTLNKVNDTFIKKLKKALNEPTEENFNKLFDRTDVIEEFYILFKKAREFMLKNITGISEEGEREEFVDNFMMQMLTLWYLQERGFFNNNPNYFVTKFKELGQKKLFGEEFKNYYEFLQYFFEKISNNVGEQYYKDDKVGKVVVVGPAVFINGEQKRAISIPDKCFYKDDFTNILINTRPKKVGDEVPLLNLFESRDWTEGNIDEFVLGAIYEKLITYQERKRTGAYYTPEEITSYICKNTIEPYLVDRMSEKFSKEFKSIDQIIESDDKSIIVGLFEELKGIKILDPAVGSGHFLESAINVLLRIYEMVWEKAKELGIKKGLTILTSNEKGEIERVELLNIVNEEKFKLFVKFFIILSKNIYGVDINLSALKVARARLFLTLAKHFKIGKERDIFIRFPNVHFNLRMGNSLIGYIEFKEKEQKKQRTIFDVMKEEQAQHVVEKIKVLSELREYLEKIAATLNLGDVLREVENLNRIIAKKNIEWKDFEKVLRTKEKLIKILIASLNSQYAIPLNELLREITNLFNHKLDEKFAEEHNIDVEDLKKIKTFHWIFEFPEVFLKEKPGFNIVIGNPPYIRSKDINIKEKRLFDYFYKSPFGSYDIFIIFIERSISLLQNKCYISLITSNKLLIADYAEKIRNILIKKTILIELIDFSRIKSIFHGALISPSIFISKKDNIKEYFTKIKFLNSNEEVRTLDNLQTFKIAKEKISKGIQVSSKENIMLIEFIKNKFVPLGINSNIEIRTGIMGFEYWKFEKYIIDKDSKTKKEWCVVTNGHLDRYHFKWGTSLRLYKKKYNKPCLLPTAKSILSSETVAMFSETPKLIIRGVAKKLSAYLDVIIGVAPLVAVHTIFINKNLDVNNKRLLLKYLLLLLNSNLLDRYHKITFYTARIPQGSLRYPVSFLKELPIPIIKMDTNVFVLISDYLLFLNTTEEQRQRFKNIIEFFDRHIADSLVYELYFKEKFTEDGLYPEPKEYLLEAVSKHLKPIDYDRWAELYWKKKLEENLSEEEEKESERLEKENIKIIDKVYSNLRHDEEVEKWINKIKSHKWIKVIEGE